MSRLAVLLLKTMALTIAAHPDLRDDPRLLQAKDILLFVVFSVPEDNEVTALLEKVITPQNWDAMKETFPAWQDIEFPEVEEDQMLDNFWDYVLQTKYQGAEVQEWLQSQDRSQAFPLLLVVLDFVIRCGMQVSFLADSL